MRQIVTLAIVGLAVGLSSTALAQQRGRTGPSKGGQEVRPPVHYPAPVFREQALKELVPSDPARRSAIEVDELVSRPDIPPPRRYTPVLKDLPNSFVTQSYTSLRGNYDITGLDIGKRASLSEPGRLTLNSFILDSAPDEVGRIEEVEVGEKVASVGQSVIVRMTKGTRVGERYSVVYSKGTIKDRDRGQIGPIVDAGGVVEITGAVDESKGAYRALVMSSVNPILVGSILIEGELPTATFAAVGSLRNIEARVIGGEFDARRSLLGANSTIYLDKGADAGLAVGDLLAVQARRASRRSKTQFPEALRSIGIVKVAQVGRGVATAVVVEGKEEILPGDRTGGRSPDDARSIDYRSGSPLQQEEEKEIDLFED